MSFFWVLNLGSLILAGLVPTASGCASPWRCSGRC
jgi:hypothetical protein